MGSIGSKIDKQSPNEDLQEGSVPSTPILTPKSKKIELDPRSPSTNISRTPLELISTNDEQFESEFILQNENTPMKTSHLLLGIDPRSPTTEFERTPIMIDALDTNLLKKLHNKNLDKVRLSTNTATPKSANNILSSEKQADNIIPPKLLESSPIKPKPDSNKRKSFVGLLETNIDFTETDLDAVIQRKNMIHEKINEFASPNFNKNIKIIKCAVDPRSPTTDFIRTPIQVIKKISEIELNEKDKDTISRIIKENKFDIEETVNKPKILEIINNDKDNEYIREFCEVDENIAINQSQEIHSTDKCELAEQVVDNISMGTKNTEVSTVMEDLLNDTPVLSNPEETKSTPVTPDIELNFELECGLKQTNSAPVTPPLINITADVIELDKKLTNLIYQDDTIICPRVVKLKELNERSPLKNRNGNEPIKTKTLKVSDRPRKSDYAVSKIPVFKEKVKQVQCENTPPRNMEMKKNKVRKSHWDNTDTTLII